LAARPTPGWGADTFRGATYEAYKAFWNRDSYNNAGAALISTVHYSTDYCNAYWDGTQMVYGDGDSSQGCKPLGARPERDSA
jgi:Zn-dependent metalloprotease